MDFLRRGATINSEYYCRVLSDVHTRLRGKKWPGLIIKGVLILQDNARPHTAHRITCTLQQLGWEVSSHPPYRLKPATWITPQPNHTETPTHIETRTHDQCGDTIEKSQTPDDGRINVRNKLTIEKVK